MTNRTIAGFNVHVNDEGYLEDPWEIAGIPKPVSCV